MTAPTAPAWLSKVLEHDFAFPDAGDLARDLASMAASDARDFLQGMFGAQKAAAIALLVARLFGETAPQGTPAVSANSGSAVPRVSQKGRKAAAAAITAAEPTSVDVVGGGTGAPALPPGAPAGMIAYRKSDQAESLFPARTAAVKPLSFAAATATCAATVATSPASVTEATGVKGKTFVPLSSEAGQKVANAVPAGRRVCSCGATKHALVNNCTSCGKIVCAQEGPGLCSYCGALVCSPADMETLARNSKKSEKLREKLLSAPSPAPDAAAVAADAAAAKLAAATANKERLLHYDRTSAQRMRVIDDGMDYFSHDTNQWLSTDARTALKRKEEALRDSQLEAKKRRTFTLDFAGRRVVADAASVDNIYDHDANAPEAASGSSSAAAALAAGLVDVLAGGGVAVKQRQATEARLADFQRTLEAAKRVAMGQDDPAVGCGSAEGDGGALSCATMAKSGPPVPKELKYAVGTAPAIRCSGATARPSRLQACELDELGDAGMCLSMHQPHASLLVRGIKQHEGRNWYSAHRGRLWIAAGVKAVTASEIDGLETFYRAYHDCDDMLVFPEAYPTGCLLGCVNVDDVLPQAEYRQRFPDGESESPFVFICSRAQELVVCFSMTGQHKIYKLGKGTHESARESLVSVDPGPVRRAAHRA